MKHRVICILSLIFLFISCHSTNDVDANRVAHFRTRDSNGLYYFMDNSVIKPVKGVLSIKNISNYKVLLSIYNKTKHDLFINDLKRYKIETLLIDDFEEITEIFREIYKRLIQNNVFISGSAKEYGKLKEEDALKFISQLSQTLIQKDFNIISGFGLGVGSAVIIGALQEIYMKNKSINENRLLLRPFPQGIENDETRQKLWKKYREDMISRAGVSIFIFGNKLQNGKIELANGVKSEFEIAKENHNVIVPVGSTGYMAKELWEQINNDLPSYYSNVDKQLQESFAKLNEDTDISTMINSVINFIQLFTNGKYSAI